jgi:hypothetical protein
VALKVADGQGQFIFETDKSDAEVFAKYKNYGFLDDTQLFQSGVYYIYVKISGINGSDFKYRLCCYGIDNVSFQLIENGTSSGDVRRISDNNISGPDSEYEKVVINLI